MGKKDDVSKKYMQDNSRFADLVNYAVFDGEQVISPEDLVEKDPTEIGIVTTLPHGFFTKQKVRDVFKGCVVRETESAVFVLFGLENQSEIHYAMPVKNGLYDMLDYCRQVDETAKRNKEEKKLSGGSEFLSGITRKDKLIPVVTICLYLGDNPWDGPECLHDMLEFQDSRLKKFVPDYRINLIDPHRITDFEKFHTDLRELMEILEASGSGSKLNELVENNRERFSNLSGETGTMVETFTDLHVVIRKRNGKERVDMCQAVEEIKNEARKEGWNAGRNEGWNAGRKEGWNAGRNEGWNAGRNEGWNEGRNEGRNEERITAIRNVMKFMDCPAEKAMDILCIPEGERSFFVEKL